MITKDDPCDTAKLSLLCRICFIEFN